MSSSDKRYSSRDCIISSGDEDDDSDINMTDHSRYDRHYKRSQRRSASPSDDRKRQRHSRQQRQEDGYSSQEDDERPKTKHCNDKMIPNERHRNLPLGFKPPHPSSFDYIIPYKQYCEYIRYTHPSKRLDDHDLKRRYESYKEDFNAQQLAKFFEANKDKQWFLEKYHPTHSQLRKNELKERRLRYYHAFMNDIDNGLLDSIELDDGKTYVYQDKKKQQKNNDNISNNNNNSNKDDEDTNNDDENNDNNDSNDDENNENNNNENKNNDEYETQLVIKTVLPTISREDILKLCETVDGFDYLALSEPGPNKRFHRIGWINFKEGTDMKEAFNQLNNKKVDEFIFHLAMNKKNQQPLPRTPRLALEISNTKERLKHDLDQAYLVAKAMDSFLEVKGAKKVANHATQINRDRRQQQRQQQQQDEDEDEEDADDHYEEKNNNNTIISIKKELDLLIVYLRRVHMMCYYCGLECDSLEDLDRKCMEPHLRQVISKSQENQASHLIDKGVLAWAKNLDSKLTLKYERPSHRALERMGGKILEDELEKFYSENVEKEHHSKYRCKIENCNKAFKGYEFVEKHINSKHTEFTDKIKENTTYFNNYICDPNHLTPQANPSKNINNNTNPNMMMPTMPPRGAPSHHHPHHPHHPPFVMFSPHGNVAPMIPANMIPTGMNMIPGFNRIPPSNLMEAMGPRDPRQMTSYVDLDAPTNDGENVGPAFY
ncbi:unnamed protein product [Cunninghamella blakesleeana]